MRSTFAASMDKITGSTSPWILWRGTPSKSVKDALGQRPDVGRNEGGLQDPALQAIQVQQIGHQAVEPAGVGGEPPRQLSAILRSEPELFLLLQREGETKDCRERGPEVMRDGLEKRVLDLVHGSQPLDGVTLPFQSLFGLLHGRLPAPGMPHHGHEDGGHQGTSVLSSSASHPACVRTTGAMSA
jgi:hypothetical protein